MTCTYCPGCNTDYVDIGCGQDREHTQCPVNCGICGEPITGRDTRNCQGHSIAEAIAHVDALRGRA